MARFARFRLGVRQRLLLSAACVAVAAFAVPAAAQDTEQYWDGTNTTPGNVVNGRGTGDGTWDNTSTNWTNQPGSANAPWAGGVAIFGGGADASGNCSVPTGAVINVTATGVSARELRALCAAPTFRGGAISLTTGARLQGRFIFENTVNAAGDVLADNSTINVNGVINIAGDLTINGGLFRVQRTNGGPVFDVASVTADDIVLRTVNSTDIAQLIASFGGKVTARSVTIDRDNSGPNLGGSIVRGGLLDVSGGDVVIGDTGSARLLLGGFNGGSGVAGDPAPITKNGELRARNVILGRSAGGFGELNFRVGGDLFNAIPEFVGSPIVGGNNDDTFTGQLTAQTVTGGVGGGRVVFFNNFDQSRDIVRANALNFTPQLTGNLAVTIDGPEVRLSGVHDYTGPTRTLFRGILSLDGASLTRTNVTIDGGGLLTGTGAITGTVNVTSGSAIELAGSTGALTVDGTLSPGGDGTVGTLTVNGNLVFGAGSLFRVDIGAAQASTDRITVNGTATLAGGLTAFATGGAFTAGRYTLLTATGGITGRFNPFISVPTAPVGLVYDANNVFLELTEGGTLITTQESLRQDIVFSAPQVTTNRVSAFSTQIIGRLVGGQPLFDQSFSSAFNSVAVQNALIEARAAITIAGGPGVIIGDPVRTASSTSTTTTTGATTFVLTDTTRLDPTTVVTFGPETILTGNLRVCNVTSLPSATRPTCQDGGTPTTLAVGELNFNIIIDDVFTVTETRTDTVTETLNETYELNGQVVAIGSVHAQIQSGLFDLSGRLLTRLGQITPGRGVWADAYHFRVSQGGRRDAWGISGGVALPLGERLTLAGGIGHGNIDIDVAGAQESGEVRLTELGGSLRYDSDPSGEGFAASLGVVHGFGEAQTSRAIIGLSQAEYDVEMTGASVELGYGFTAGGVAVRPLAGIDWVRISTDGFAETDTLGLIASDQNISRTRASAGLALAKDFGPVAIEVSGRYLAILDGGERGLPVAFALAPTRSLAMTGPSEPDGGLVGARASIPLAPGAVLTLGYDGRFGGGYTSHAGNLGVRVQF